MAVASSCSGSRRRSRSAGGRGGPRARSTRGARIWSGAARRPSSTTSTSTSGTRTGASPSGSRTPTRPTRSGSISTGTGGPSVSSRRQASITGARQRLSLLRQPLRPGANLRPPGPGGGAELLLAVVPSPALAVHRRGLARRLRVRARGPPVRGLRHPRLRTAARGSGLLRGPDPRPPRPRPAGTGGAGLRPQADAPDPRQVLHQGGHQRRRPPDQLHLQIEPDQAVPEGGPRPPHRDRHQQHPRFRDWPPRQCGQLEGPEAVGDSANQRLCDAQAQDAAPAPDVVTLTQVTRPTKTPDGLHAPALCFGDPRVMALLAALVGFRHVLVGFQNRQLVALVASLLSQPYGHRQATYDLQRLRRKGLIVRLPQSQRYQLTPRGRAVAVLFLKAHGRG